MGAHLCQWAGTPLPPRPLVLSMNESVSDQARIAVAKELLDWGFGKPGQEVELARDKSLTVIVNRNNALIKPPVNVPALPVEACS